MNSVSTPVSVAQPASATNYLNAQRGLLSWLTTLDHKRIAVMYMVAIFTAFFFGGILALLIRTQLLTPQGTIFATHDAYAHYNQLFTLHGNIMIFMFLVPSIPAIFGNFILPMMLGARDLAFPRINLLSFYLWLAGAVMVVMSIILGAVDTGWTFYTPYSAETGTAVSWLVGGVFILGFSSIFTGLNIIVTTHKLRPAGMTWFKLPLFVWAMYATSVILIIATPVLGVTLLLLILERLTHIGIFNSTYGGDPILFQHFFWFYSHPAVYIMILPSMGVESEIIAVFSRRQIFGYKFIAMSSVAIAGVGFLVWGHHMFVAGQSAIMDVIFSFLTFIVAIPSGVKVFNWLATLYKGSIRLKTPMLYALGFIWLFTIGGLTGLFLGALAVDTQVHDTYFVIAHFHYIMVAGSLMGILGALHYWWPKMFGRMYNETLGRIAWTFIFIGYNITFFPQFIIGAHGMPRRYAHYLPAFQPYHVVSTIGAYIQAVGFFLILGYLIYSLKRGPIAPANPWGGATLEWQTAAPPPTDNFTQQVVVAEPYDYTNLHYDKRINGYVRNDPPPLSGEAAHA
jgi:cytochrome c oxidase subunit 1